MGRALAHSPRSIPGLSPSLVAMLEDLQSEIRQLRGIGGQNTDDSAVTKGNLLEWGLGQAGPYAGQIIPGPSSEAIDLSIPLPPSSLEALGGYALIFVKWQAPTDTKRGYFEIYRSTTNDVGTAQKVGQTPALFFVDHVQNSSQYYYWVRAVNKFSDSVKSAFSQVDGVVAKTSPDVTYAMEVLTGERGDQPFYYVAATESINGFTFEPGTYIKTAYIAQAFIKYLSADVAVIRSANIESLTANKITTGAMSADRIETNTLAAKLATFDTGQFQSIFANKAFFGSANIAGFLQSDNFNGNPAANNPGTTGWYLGRDGRLYASQATFSGVIKGSGLYSNATMGVYVTPPGSRIGALSGISQSWDMNATGQDLALQINGGFRVYADARVEIDNAVLNRANVLAQGIKTGNLVYWMVVPPPPPTLPPPPDSVGGA